jgi:hypothetical protein
MHLLNQDVHDLIYSVQTFNRCSFNTMWILSMADKLIVVTLSLWRSSSRRLRLSEKVLFFGIIFMKIHNKLT